MFTFENYNINLFDVISTFPMNIYVKDESGKFLWCNENQLKNLGLKTIDEFVNKTEYDFRDNQTAEKIHKNDGKVMASKKQVTAEESCVENGKEKFYISKKMPLFDKKNKIVGILGMSLDVTNQINSFDKLIKSKEQNEKSLEYILSIIPAHIYWKNKKGVYLGCNDLQAKNLGLKNRQEIVGKNDFDVSVNAEAAKKFRDNDFAVISSGENVTVEEIVVINKKETPVLSHKVPLKEVNGEILGIAGISLDITAQKEAERLRFDQIILKKEIAEAEIERLRLENEVQKLENEAYLAEKKSQEKVKNFIDKMLHDIQAFRIEELHGKIGVKPQIFVNSDQIKLTHREQQILYFLSLNKSPKEIAQIITVIENKSLSDSTINATINKKLYPKFEVFNIGQLVEKAIMLNLVPFLLDN